MPTLRDMLDGRDLSFASVPPPAAPTAAVAKPAPALQTPKPVKPANGKAAKGGKNGSPIAQHVSNHMQDPVGATKQAFGDLTKKKMDYDQAREETMRQLAPVQSVIDHVSTLHGLQPGAQTPGMMPGVPGQSGLDGNQPQMDENGDPINMAQQPGQMQMNKPSLVGAQPGAAPTPAGQVRPNKIGMASPGSPTARNSPAPPGSNPQSAQFNPAAAPPKGSKSLPGAKGPGDPKVANPVKKAQNKAPGKGNSTDRPIKVTVHAAARDYSDVSNIEAERSFSDLKMHASIQANAGSMPIGPGGAMGPSGVLPGNNPASGASMKARGKKMKALDQTSDKVDDTNNQVAFNPKFQASKTIDMCMSCGGMHLKGACPKAMKSAGHSRGAKKGWSTRGKGHLSSQEKKTHQRLLDAVAPPGREAQVKALKPKVGKKAAFKIAWSQENKHASA